MADDTFAALDFFESLEMVEVRDALNGVRPPSR